MIATDALNPKSFFQHSTHHHPSPPSRPVQAPVKMALAPTQPGGWGKGLGWTGGQGRRERTYDQTRLHPVYIFQDARTEKKDGGKNKYTINAERDRATKRGGMGEEPAKVSVFQVPGTGLAAYSLLSPESPHITST